MNEEDQASKFQDINELLLNKCSEELKGLEGAREKLQKRIDDAYRVVSRMELILHVPDPVDVASLPAVAGVTLLEHETYMLSLQKRLANELLHRINTRVRVVEGIQGLAVGLQIRSIYDFRHVSREEVGNIDDVLIRSSSANLDVCKQFQQNPDSVPVLEQLLDTLDDQGLPISQVPPCSRRSFCSTYPEREGKTDYRTGGVVEGYQISGSQVTAFSR